MKLDRYIAVEGEKPLDILLEDGGFTSIFRTIGCVGDSLSSGEFEGKRSEDAPNSYHDFYEYSWGQFIARRTGSKVYNFSRGGMTAKEYMESFAEKNDFWAEDKKCQAYIFALGVNDILHCKMPIGDIEDIDLDDYTKNKDTFCGYYAAIIQRLKLIQPRAKFFLMSMPRDVNREHDEAKRLHAELLYKLAELFDNTYVLDFFKYAPVYDEDFQRRFYLAGHLNPMGYKLTADMVMSYIDYIIRSDPESFLQVGFIGTDFYHYRFKY